MGASVLLVGVVMLIGGRLIDIWVPSVVSVVIGWTDVDAVLISTEVYVVSSVCVSDVMSDVVLWSAMCDLETDCTVVVAYVVSAVIGSY